MNITGLAVDWVEAIAGTLDDPESRPAGMADPHYPVSESVTLSREHGLFVYHLADDQLGQGSSLGNAGAWAETKGTGNMLSLFSIAAGARVLGGMSVTYLLPFSDLYTLGGPTEGGSERHHDHFVRALPSAPGIIHLHPAYQQHEFVIGDGLHVLETFFVPRTGMEDPAVAHCTVMLMNRTPHPIGVTAVASLDLRGHTPMDLAGHYDSGDGALLAHNASQPNWVRVFGADVSPTRYWITTDEEEAYSPGEPLPNSTDATGDVTGALQLDTLLLPGQRHKFRLTVAFSAAGPADALRIFREARGAGDSLKRTAAHYETLIGAAALEMPDAMLTQGVQWAKACLIRPLARYPVGECFTNDPGWSTHLVGRDIAWYVHGCDFAMPGAACDMLRVLARHQREDGLIPEFLDGNTGQTQDWGFNMNDDTPLFLMAVAHHMKATAHTGCLEELWGAARRAGELILSQRDERGLVRCTASGQGAQGICGWRNVLENEQISGVVTEVNSECYAALHSLAHLAELAGHQGAASRFADEAQRLRDAINQHLINPRNGLYVRNIGLDGSVFTQVTADLVFPLICGVADPGTMDAISARLAETDFMTEAGLRVIPDENPSYDPSFESGCLGGVWPGVTWWYAMGCCRSNPHIMSESLKRSYQHYVTDPKTYNTVPGQFSEWCDGETLVNRGMRLSPWEPPRFLWAAIEGVAGVNLAPEGVVLNPQIPADWGWLRLHGLPYRGGVISFFMARQGDGIHVYTCNAFAGRLHQHRYDAELAQGAESLTTGLTSTAFRSGSETLLCLGSARDTPTLGPFLTHHVLDSGARYQVSRLSSQASDWADLGTIQGSELQRVTVRVDARGYALYRFILC